MSRQCGQRRERESQEADTGRDRAQSREAVEEREKRPEESVQGPAARCA